MPLHIQLMSSAFLTWFKGHTRCVRTSSRGRQGRVFNHAFTTAYHSLPSSTIIFSCSTNIPLSFNTPFTSFIHQFHSFPLNLTSPTSDLTILFTNRSSILSMCLSHLNTLDIKLTSNSNETFTAIKFGFLHFYWDWNFFLKKLNKYR